jgi:hypothetical protein
VTTIGLATEPDNGGITWDQAAVNLGHDVPLRRVFDPSIPPDYARSGAGREGGRNVVYSMQCDDWVGLARGNYDEGITDFLAAVPSGVNLRLVVAHEPEDYWKTLAYGLPSDWVAAQERVRGLVDAENAKRLSPFPVKFGGVLMAYTAHKPDRDQWQPTDGTWDFLAVDGYAWDYERTPRTAERIFGAAKDWADQMGVRFQVAEFGIAANHPKRARWIRDTRAWFEDNGVGWACYYNNAQWALTSEKQWAALA